MRLTVLGCSGSVGSPGVAASGYLLQVPERQPVVLDFGPGVLGALQRFHDPNDVSVILSHLHADHCLDLPSLLVWRRWAPVPADGLARLVGPTGTDVRIGAASSEYPGVVEDISDTLSFTAWADRVPIDIGGLHVEPWRVSHPPESYGFRITGPEGEVLAYSGDTAICDEAVELARDADIFLCEASWTHDPEHRPPGVHMSGVEAGQVATAANARSLAITHVPPWTSIAQVLDEARSTFAGPIVAVQPGQVIDVSKSPASTLEA